MKIFGSLQLALALGLSAIGPSAALAQSNPTYIPFQGSSKGAFYKPDAGPASHVGIVVMHRTSNYLRHPTTRIPTTTSSSYRAAATPAPAAGTRNRRST
ncbi:MAG TPA: hypothetical protein VHN20_18930 [Beijerinckiaceae bacterium]|nr:hypothetical protein [Beijerinckiaceae bacterium]